MKSSTRTVLSFLATFAMIAVASANPTSLRDGRTSAIRSHERLLPLTARIVSLNTNYKCAGDGVIVEPPVQDICATIPEPPLGASLAGAVVIGLVYWTRRQRS